MIFLEKVFQKVLLFQYKDFFKFFYIDSGFCEIKVYKHEIAIILKNWIIIFLNIFLFTDQHFIRFLSMIF